jgi:uncharacterized Zn-finger protein
MVQGNGSVEDNWPKVLPMVQLAAKTYCVDLRLRQFREVGDPRVYVDFESDTGRVMCGRANIVSCPDCGVSIIVPSVWRGQDLSCIRCLTVLH